jgi:hypothetical protein
MLFLIRAFRMMCKKKLEVATFMGMITIFSGICA